MLNLATLPARLQRAQRLFLDSYARFMPRAQRLFQDSRARFITILALLGADVLLIVVEVYFRGTSGADIATYYQGALALRAGQDPLQAAVNYAAHYRPGMMLPGLYVYPQAFAVLYVPLTFLPFSAALVVWAVCALALIGLTVYALFRALRRRPSFLLLTVITSLVFWAFPVRTGISLGQPYPLVLCGLACALWARQAGHPVAGGFLLGLASVSKPEILILAAVWLWKRELLLAVSTILSFLLVLIAPVPWLGLRGLTELALVWRVWSNSYLPPLYDLSFKGLLVRLFSPNPVIPPIVNAPLLATLLWLLLVAIIVLLTACRVRQRPLDATPLCLLEVGLTLSAVLLVSPRVEDHYLAFLAPAFVALVAFALDQGAGADHRRTACFAAAGVWALWSLPLNTPEGLLYTAMLSHPIYAGVLEIIEPLFLYEMIAIFAMLLWAVGRLSGQSWRSAVRATLSDLAGLLSTTALWLLSRRVAPSAVSKSAEVVDP